MTETRRFIKESTIYTIGEILTKSLAFILIPVFTRYLTQDEYGIYNLVITIWPVLVILYGKGFASYIMRGYFEIESDKGKKEFVGTILLFSLIISLFLAALTHVFGGQLFGIVFKNMGYRPFLQFAVGIAIFKLFTNNVLAVYRAERKPVSVVSLSLVNFIITVGFILVLVVYLKMGLIGALQGQIWGLVIVSVFFFIYVMKDIRLTIKKRYLSSAILFVLPLIPHALSGWVINLSDRIFIERYCTLEDLAIYSLGYQLALALDILINSMNQAWMPFFYANAEKSENRKELRKSANFFFFSVVSLGLVLSLFSKEIILIAGRQSYAAAANIFPLIILAFVIHSVYYMTTASIFYRMKTGIIPVITIVSGAISIVLNIIFIPKYGYIAAAYTTIVSFSMAAFLGYLFSRRYFPIPFQLSKMLTIFILAAVLYILSTLFPETSLILNLILKIAFILIYILLIFTFRIIRFKELKDIKSFFFNKSHSKEI